MADTTQVGILGGIFDPVHYGHLATAKLALDFFNLDKIYFVPAGTPAHKSSPHASPLHRLAMLKLGIGTTKGFEVWDGEMKRSGPSYTVDTLKALKKRHRHSPLHFIIGSDNLVEIPLWHDYKAILKRSVFCVAHRPGHSLRVPRILSSMKMKPFPGPEWKISSTMVRSYLSRGYSCEFLLPSKVVEYIKAHGLYTQEPNEE